MRLEHHLVGGYVRYISPYIIIIYVTVTRPLIVDITRTGLNTCKVCLNIRNILS